MIITQEDTATTNRQIPLSLICTPGESPWEAGAEYCRTINWDGFFTISEDNQYCILIPWINELDELDERGTDPNSYADPELAEWPVLEVNEDEVYCGF